MSLRPGSRPEWLYWPKDGHWQLHVSWLRLHIAFWTRKSKRRSNNLAGARPWQRSAADDLALTVLAGFALPEYAAFVLAGFTVLALARFTVLALAGFTVLAPTESAALALVGSSALESQAVAQRAASALRWDRGRVASPPLPHLHSS